MVVSSLAPASKQTSKNLNYFKTYASGLSLGSLSHSYHSLRAETCTHWTHTRYNYCTCNSSLRQLLSPYSQSPLTNNHFIHIGALHPPTIPLHCSCSIHRTIYTLLTCIITLLLLQWSLHCIMDSYSNFTTYCSHYETKSFSLIYIPS